MDDSQSLRARTCPDCGQPLHTLWDYPSNEIWCLSCGHRFYEEPSDVPSRGCLRADPLRGFRILLLDGNAARRDSLTRRLAGLGYQVTPVCHPRQLLEAASFQRFDLVLLGWNADDSDLVSLAKRLRRQLGPVRLLFFSPQRPTLPPEGDPLSEAAWVQVARG